MTKTSEASPPELKTLDEVIEYLQKGPKPAPTNLTLRLGNVKRITKACGFNQLTDVIDQVLSLGKHVWITFPSEAQDKAAVALKSIRPFEGITSAKEEAQVVVRLFSAVEYKREVQWLEEHVLPLVS